MRAHRITTVCATFDRVGPAGLRAHTSEPPPPLTITVPEHTGRHRDASAHYLGATLHRYVHMWLPEGVHHYRVDVDLHDNLGNGAFTIAEVLIGAARWAAEPRRLGGGTLAPLAEAP